MKQYPASSMQKSDYFLKKSKPTLVWFYMPWCGHCKDFIDDWNTLSGNNYLNEKVDFAAIDCEKNQEMKDYFKVRSFPSLKFVYNNDFTNFDKPRNLKNVKKFIELNASKQNAKYRGLVGLGLASTMMNSPRLTLHTSVISKDYSIHFTYFMSNFEMADTFNAQLFQKKCDKLFQKMRKSSSINVLYVTNSVQKYNASKTVYVKITNNILKKITLERDTPKVVMTIAERNGDNWHETSYITPSFRIYDATKFERQCLQDIGINSCTIM